MSRQTYKAGDRDVDEYGNSGSDLCSGSDMPREMPVEIEIQGNIDNAMETWVSKLLLPASSSSSCAVVASICSSSIWRIDRNANASICILK